MPSLALQIALSLYPLCLAGLAAAWILSARSANRSRWLVDVAAGASIAAFAYLAGPWAFTSYYLRYALLGIVALLSVLSWRRRISADTVHSGHSAGGLVTSASLLVIFTALNASALAARAGVRESIDLSFPLSAGTYYVMQGGDNWVTNPFHTLAGTRLALDIVRLNGFGNRALGPAPRALEDYEIFRDTIHSPCTGTVVAVRDDVPDHAPGEADMERPAGNHVVVKCGEVDVLMAHMKQNSIMIAAGDVVSLGQPLGQVGNSGNTLEPHLHIEAHKKGADLELLFDGRRLSLNSVVVADQSAAIAKTDRPQAGGRDLLKDESSMSQNYWDAQDQGHTLRNLRGPVAAKLALLREYTAGA